MDPIRELKVRAELLHHAVRAAELPALRRLRTLRELRHADEQAVRAAAAAVQRKHCLATVAREVGFSSWEHARRVLEGDHAEVDLGTLLYRDGHGAQLNHWFATYDEARGFHAAAMGRIAPAYLLAYRRHFFVADRHFVASLGLAYDHADWRAIGWDWARPRSVDARRRLYGRLLSATPPPSRAARGPS